MLRSAQLQAEVDRINMLQEFTMGHHARLGAASQVNTLSAGVMQMVMDYV